MHMTLHSPREKCSHRLRGMMLSDSTSVTTELETEKSRHTHTREHTQQSTWEEPRSCCTHNVARRHVSRSVAPRGMYRDRWHLAACITIGGISRHVPQSVAPRGIYHDRCHLAARVTIGGTSRHVSRSVARRIWQVRSVLCGAMLSGRVGGWVKD